MRREISTSICLKLGLNAQHTPPPKKKKKVEWRLASSASVHRGLSLTWTLPLRLFPAPRLKASLTSVFLIYGYM